MSEGVPYQFNVMPNGYLDAMRMLTKVLKPVFAFLREEGHLSIIYVDDSVLGVTLADCQVNIDTTVCWLKKLGFTIHPGKSVLIPTTVINFLGFTINTLDMTITLKENKKIKIKDLAMQIRDNVSTIRLVSKLLGHISVAFEAVDQGKMHYRHIEFCKINALKKSRGNRGSTGARLVDTKYHVSI